MPRKQGTSWRAAMSLETQSQITAIAVISHHPQAGLRAMQAARKWPALPAAHTVTAGTPTIHRALRSMDR